MFQCLDAVKLTKRHLAEFRKVFNNSILFKRNYIQHCKDNIGTILEIWNTLYPLKWQSSEVSRFWLGPMPRALLRVESSAVIENPLTPLTQPQHEPLLGWYEGSSSESFACCSIPSQSHLIRIDYFCSSPPILGLAWCLASRSVVADLASYYCSKKQHHQRSP